MSVLAAVTKKARPAALPVTKQILALSLIFGCASDISVTERDRYWTMAKQTCANWTDKRVLDNAQCLKVGTLESLHRTAPLLLQINIQFCCSAAPLTNFTIFCNKTITLSIATVEIWLTTSTVNIFLIFLHHIDKKSCFTLYHMCAHWDSLIFSLEFEKVKFSFLSAKGTLSEDTIRRFLRQLGEKKQRKLNLGLFQKANSRTP